MLIGVLENRDEDVAKNNRNFVWCEHAFRLVRTTEARNKHPERRDKRQGILYRLRAVLMRRRWVRSDGRH